MVVFPNAKINLGLHVTRKRSDGFHDLETIFYPVGINDILEFIPSSRFSFRTTGLPIHGDYAQNLCVKAWQLIKSAFPDLPEPAMHLHKVIPMGAGLGGGSADGSFVLKALNEYFNLKMTTDRLLALALELGSDCPFFIGNKPCFATGRGEILEPIELSLSGFEIIIAYPGISVNTGEAFSGIVPGQAPYSLKDKILEPLEKWKGWLVNDFEQTVFHKFPEIGLIKDKLYDSGAVYASMSGSGSSCFGIFKTSPLLDFPPQYKVFRVPVK